LAADAESVSGESLTSEGALGDGESTLKAQPPATDEPTRKAQDGASLGDTSDKDADKASEPDIGSVSPTLEEDASPAVEEPYQKAPESATAPPTHTIKLESPSTLQQESGSASDPLGDGVSAPTIGESGAEGTKPDDEKSDEEQGEHGGEKGATMEHQGSGKGEEGDTKGHKGRRKRRKTRRGKRQ